MSLSIHCCEGFSIKRLFCSCAGDESGKKTKKNKEQILYTDAAKRVVILSTPQMEFPDLAVLEDLPLTDVAVFSADEEGVIRYTSIQGVNLFRSVTEAQESYLEEMGGVEAAFGGGLESKGEDSVGTGFREVKCPEDVAGMTIEDALPKYMLRFLKPIYEQTLQGNYLQLMIMWMNSTHLFRTFPIFDHRKRVIGGMAITSPFTNQFNGDINRFSLHSQQQQKKAEKKDKSVGTNTQTSTPPSGSMIRMGRRIRRLPTRQGHAATGPRPQLMESNHSGMLQSSIVPDRRDNSDLSVVDDSKGAVV